MNNGDTFEFPGGIYYYGDETDDRTDIQLEVDGPGINEALGTPQSFNLRFITGNGEFTLVNIMPSDLYALGKWLQDAIKYVT